MPSETIELDKDAVQQERDSIRKSLRNIDEVKLKKARAEIEKFRGISKRKITDEEYEWIRHHAFLELEKEKTK